MDVAIWGADGARVIDTTERLIDAMHTGDTEALLCEDADIEFGDAQDWDSTAAGEPEKYNAEYFPDYAALDPDWMINVEHTNPDLQSGDVIPGDVFYRKTDDGPCVLDVSWVTVA